MHIDRDTIANKLTRYLQHEISLEELVDWAEDAMMNAEFEASNAKQLGEIVGRLGVADVRAFGLTWDTCERILKELGYDVHLTITHR